MSRIQPNEITEKSVEQICERMLNVQCVPMDVDTSKIMIMFLMSEDSKERSVEILDKIWQADAIVRRMKLQFGRDLDPRAAVIIAAWAKSIGSCILYMYYCQYQAIKHEIDGEFDLNHLINIFPVGFFPNEEMHKIWDSQKVDNKDELFAGLRVKSHGDNLVDYPYAAQSIGGIVPAEPTAV